MDTAPPILEASAVCKAFAGVRALDGVAFAARAGEVHALMGENGAGKSTLIKILSGVFPANSGELRLLGKAFAPRTPAEARALGVSTVFQEVNLVPDLSVAENIMLGRLPRTWYGIDWPAARRRAEELLARLGVDIDVSRPLNSYPVAVRQMAAIARALDRDARVLILDEPTSSLDENEVGRLFGVMRKLKADGLALVFVSHFLDQIYAVSDRITVLRNGRLAGEYPAAELPRLELVARMLGKDVTAVAAAEHSPNPSSVRDTTPTLKATGLGRRGIGPVDVTVRAGEVVGLAGLLGSGRTETVRMIFGVDPAEAGTLEIDGAARRVTSPRHAMRAGMAYCPEDRKSAGLVPDLSVRENIVLALQANRGVVGRVGRQAQDELAAKFIKALGIATPDAEKPAGLLSGGNQQKVILARWLAVNPKLLILDEPTRGIDVGAKGEIEKLIARLSGEGMAVLFVSSELEEEVRSCHRVVILRDRKVVGELDGDAVTVSAVMHSIAAPAPAGARHHE